MITPTIFYFDVKARAEPLKVALSLKNVQYDYQVVPWESIKNFEEYPFGQAPRYKDDTIDMVQSNAILRHIGRKYGLYGQGLEQQAEIDMIVDGVDDLTVKTYKPTLIDKSEESQSAYWATHGEPSSKKEKNGGAHWALLDAVIKRNKGAYATAGVTTHSDR
ncbi:hypothetical protein WJX84_008036 [Apatococcus fuscideae]|uniref:glutathione transferase n=1 Tax=Apatococcus fuscideae TaxID=2026836 RepID=A0AAW1SUS6_9CHLO